MADKKVTELTSITNLSGDDLLLVVNDPSGSPSSNKVTVANMFANVVSETTFKSSVSINGNLLLKNQTPSTNVSSNEGHTAGSIWFDEDYIYVAVSGGTIKRAALSTF